MDLPLVSIITPVLNDRKFISICLDSVLSQDYTHTEHIFVDGGSTDGTEKVLEDVARANPGRVVVITAVGSKPGEAWNIGLKAAKGDIFGCIGADDICEPGAVRAAVDFFQSHPDASFLYGHCELINEAGAVVGLSPATPFNYKRFVNTTFPVSTPSSYYRRAVIERIGWMDSSGDDFDAMCRIGRHYEMHNIDRVLSKLTLRTNSAFYSGSDFKRQKANYRQTYLISRKYGGSRFSPLARRHYYAVLIGALGLQFAYPTLRRLSRKIRGIRSRTD